MSHPQVSPLVISLQWTCFPNSFGPFYYTNTQKYIQLNFSNYFISHNGMKICLIRRTSRSKHSSLLRDTERGAARWRSLLVTSHFKLEWAAGNMIGRGNWGGESNRNTLQFVLPPHPSYRVVGEPATAAAPHAQVLPEQLVHTFLTVPFTGWFPDTYEPAVALL